MCLEVSPLPAPPVLVAFQPCRQNYANRIRIKNLIAISNPSPPWRHCHHRHNQCDQLPFL